MTRATTPLALLLLCGCPQGSFTLPASSTTGDDSSSGDSSSSPTTTEPLDTTSEPTPDPRCGDGAQDPGELCDDGNRVAADGCEPDCTPTPGVCGDGQLARGELCDDGPDNGAYGHCAGDCAGPGPRCGDGEIDAPHEACDDGDRDDEDACSNDCDPPRTVFITSEARQGDLGGLAGADAFCDKISARSPLPSVQGRTFRAWLSDSDPDNAPAMRIQDPEFAGWYVTTTGALVARGFADLTTEQAKQYLQTAIDRDENAADAPSGAVWTNTLPAGTRASGVSHCDDWNSNAAGDNGVTGLNQPMFLGENWTQDDLTPCDTQARVYCFEVPG